MGNGKIDARLIDAFIAKYILRLENVHKWVGKGYRYYGAIPGYAKPKILGEWYAKYQAPADAITGYKFVWPIPNYQPTPKTIVLLLVVLIFIEVAKWKSQR